MTLFFLAGPPGGFIEIRIILLRHGIRSCADLARVTDNHMHIYTARTSGEVKDMRRPLRFRTSTRGFATTVELQQAVSRGPVLARRLRRRQGGNRRELRGRGSATVESGEVVRWLRVRLRAAAPRTRRLPARHGSLTIYATRRCSSTMS